MATLPIVFMFSGQGSHYYQMGRELFEQQPVFRQTLLQLDNTARELMGQSVVETLYDPQHEKMDVFDHTRFTHPAIFMVEVALAQTLLAADITPDYVLGTSMGAIAAATVAGSLNADRALEAVIQQTDALEKHCPEGGMMAILDSPALYDEYTELSAHSTLAAINFDKHFVISALARDLTEIEQWLRGREVTYQRLAVSQAFHSAIIDPAEKSYLAFTSRQALSTPAIPFVCAMNGSLLPVLPTAYFWQVIRAPIEFAKTIQFLEAKNNYHYIDLGPSGTLATFLKYSLTSQSRSRASALITLYGKEMDKLKQIINS